MPIRTLGHPHHVFWFDYFFCLSQIYTYNIKTTSKCTPPSPFSPPQPASPQQQHPTKPPSPNTAQPTPGAPETAMSQPQPAVSTLLYALLLLPPSTPCVMLTYPTARLLSRSIAKRIRRRHRRRRRPSMRHLLEINRIHRLLWQQLILRRSHRGASHQSLSCGEQPSMRTKRIDWHKPIRRQFEL